MSEETTNALFIAVIASLALVVSLTLFGVILGPEEAEERCKEYGIDAVRCENMWR